MFCQTEVEHPPFNMQAVNNLKYNHTMRYKYGWINPLWVLLDNNYNIDVFLNGKMLHNTYYANLQYGYIFNRRKNNNRYDGVPSKL